MCIFSSNFWVALSFFIINNIPGEIQQVGFGEECVEAERLFSESCIEFFIALIWFVVSFLCASEEAKASSWFESVSQDLGWIWWGLDELVDWFWNLRLRSLSCGFWSASYVILVGHTLFLCLPYEVSMFMQFCIVF